MAYTDLENVRILVSLLKQNGIRKVIVNPGSMNISFVGSIQDDDFFELYSCVDERSAAYMACGLAQMSGEPVVLTCTGATASRNYAPGLTEAYYSNIPILAVTAAQHESKIGQNIPQIIDRRAQFNDMVVKSVYVPIIYNDNDRTQCITNINDAIIALKKNGGGPSHIDLETSYGPAFSHKNLEKARKIEFYTQNDALFPEIKADKVGIFIGKHAPFSEDEQQLIDEFCEKYNAVVICDSTSNYFGKYRIMGANLVLDQEKYKSSLCNFDLLIHIGNISGAYMNLQPKNVIRVCTDGKIKDTFRKAIAVFCMPEKTFFKTYNSMKNERKDVIFYKEWKDEIKNIYSNIDYEKMPLSNIWICHELEKKLPEKSNLHLGILNSLRSWNYIPTKKQFNCICNTGGFGIDGALSTTLGMSLATPSSKVYCILGDLAFFYDMNSLGNINNRDNLRILLINNGCGTEFHHYSHYASILGDKLEFVAADGHFGKQSTSLVKNYVESLGFRYLTANSKTNFIEAMTEFIDDDSGQSIVFEVFTDSKDESDALQQVRTAKSTVTGDMKNIVKKIIGR